MICRAFRGRNRLLTAQLTRNVTHCCVRSCCEGSWNTTAMDDWCNKEFCPCLICFFSSRVPEDSGLVISELHVASLAGFDKAILIAFHSSALHKGHFCTASQSG